MKKFAFFLFATMLMCLVSSNEAYAIKIKIKGSGGIVQSGGGDPDICPESSRELCAIVDGSIWDLLFGMVAPPPGGGPIVVDQPVKLTVFDDGRQINHFDQIQLLSVAQSATFNKVDNENYDCNDQSGSAFKFRYIE